ncbi:MULTISPECIES: hypothetical protein [unclassified Pseudomonas]|uniref:hypothetical protein n=1 Tax=unclassified Pseudomonas TaxID=196821 RepID=UPI001304B798|nr:MULTISPECIES: hypothetical protein [unclassified Pseudomonas]
MPESWDVPKLKYKNLTQVLSPTTKRLDFILTRLTALSFHWSTHKIDSSNPAREVSMKHKKPKAQSAPASRLRAEEPCLPNRVSASQRHFLKVAAACGKEMEPDGWLAGGRT